MIGMAARNALAAAAVGAVTYLCAIGSPIAAPVVEFGSPVALVEPAGGYVGQLAVTPDHGPPGTLVTIAAEGLPADQEFDLVWYTVEGRWNVGNGEYHGRTYDPVAYRIASVRTDGEGRVAASFAAPEDFGFQHDIVLQQGDRLFTQAAFNLDMTVELLQDHGPLGTPIAVEIKGIGWRQLQNSWLLLYDNAFTGWISAVTTRGTARFTIPATGAPGVHVLEVLHGDFTFPYRNMQQSPEPDRPTFVRHFTITPGEAVLPPPPEQQTQAEVRGLAEPGELVASPRSSTVGQPVIITGQGLSPGKRYELHWQSLSGNRVSGGGWTESSQAIAAGEADDAGQVAFRFDAPDDLGGAHQLSVSNGETVQTGTLWIAPSALPLDVESGPAGTSFTIHLKGVGWSETANIYTIVYDNGYIGYACGFNSNGDVEIFLQATGEPGWHFIDLYPAIYRGTESRPVNFRIPQLTYAEDHPGEDLPRFRFAFRIVESEGQPSQEGRFSSVLRPRPSQRTRGLMRRADAAAHRLCRIPARCLRPNGSAVDAPKGGEQAGDPGVADPVVERLALAAGGDEAVGAQQRQMLRQRRLAEADAFGERADRHLAGLRQLAEDQQPLLVGEEAQGRAHLGHLALQVRDLVGVGHRFHHFRYC